MVLLIFTPCSIDQIIPFLHAIYQPVSEIDGVDASLCPGESWTIGYDTEQVKTISEGLWGFYVHEGQDVVVDFLMLFLSTEYLDLSAIIQESPFEGNGQYVPPSVGELPSSCHTMCVPIVGKMGRGWAATPRGQGTILSCKGG